MMLLVYIMEYLLERVSWDIQSQPWHAEASTHRLLQGGILLLRADSYDIVNNLGLYMLISICLRWVEKPTAVPATMGKRTERAAFSKMADGSVRDGM
jgi:hypothetical protein